MENDSVNMLTWVSKGGESYWKMILNDDKRKMRDNRSSVAAYL